MPRLTIRDYLKIRHFLTRLWDQDDGGSFAVLPGYAQRDLHDFFAPTVSMTDEYAVTYRVQMTKAPRAATVCRPRFRGTPRQPRGSVEPDGRSTP